MARLPHVGNHGSGEGALEADAADLSYSNRVSIQKPQHPVTSQRGRNRTAKLGGKGIVRERAQLAKVRCSGGLKVVRRSSNCMGKGRGVRDPCWARGDPEEGRDID